MAASWPVLKILFVGYLPPNRGGSCILNGQILQGLAALGHQIQAISPIVGRKPEQENSCNPMNFPVAWYSLPGVEIWPKTYEEEEYRKQEAGRVRCHFQTLVSRNSFDLVLAGHECCALYVPDLARAAQLPCVLVAHSGATSEMLRHEGNESFRNLLLAQLHKVDDIICVGEHIAQQLRHQGLTRIEVVPNGVDLEQFRPRPKPPSLMNQWGLAGDEVVVMHLSNLKPIKRPLDLVYSAQEAILANPRLFYVIVGNGPLRENMEEACRQAYLSRRFRFVDWVARSRLVDYFNLADLVVMPSEAEGQALVYLETQACSRLIVASDVAGAREVIRDGETGLLFRKGDIADLTRKTLQAAADPELRDKLGKQARKQVESRSLNSMVARYAQILRTYWSRNDGGKGHVRLNEPNQFGQIPT